MMKWVTRVLWVDASHVQRSMLQVDPTLSFCNYHSLTWIAVAAVLCRPIYMNRVESQNSCFVISSGMFESRRETLLVYFPQESSTTALQYNYVYQERPLTHLEKRSNYTIKLFSRFSACFWMHWNAWKHHFWEFIICSVKGTPGRKRKSCWGQNSVKMTVKPNPHLWIWTEYPSLKHLVNDPICLHGPVDFYDFSIKKLLHPFLLFCFRAFEWAQEPQASETVSLQMDMASCNSPLPVKQNNTSSLQKPYLHTLRKNFLCHKSFLMFSYCIKCMWVSW